MRTATVCIAALLVAAVQAGWSTTTVNLTLYGEALCPDTETFVLRSLSVAMKEVCPTPTPCTGCRALHCSPCHPPPPLPPPGGRLVHIDLRTLGQCRDLARWQVSVPARRDGVHHEHSSCMRSLLLPIQVCARTRVCVMACVCDGVCV